MAGRRRDPGSGSLGHPYLELTPRLRLTPRNRRLTAPPPAQPAYPGSLSQSDRLLGRFRYRTRSRPAVRRDGVRRGPAIGGAGSPAVPRPGYARGRNFPAYDAGSLAASSSMRRTLAMIAAQSRSRSQAGFDAGAVSTMA